MTGWSLLEVIISFEEARQREVSKRERDDKRLFSLAFVTTFFLLTKKELTRLLVIAIVSASKLLLLFLAQLESQAFAARFTRSFPLALLSSPSDWPNQAYKTQ